MYYENGIFYRGEKKGLKPDLKVPFTTAEKGPENGPETGPEIGCKCSNISILIYFPEFHLKSYCF